MVAQKTTSGGKTATFTEPFEGWARGREEAWLPELRQAGLQQFAAVGLPTAKAEDWRFTPLTPLARLPFRPMLEAPTEWPALQDLKPLMFAGLAGPQLVFVNGHFVAELSSIEGLPSGVTLEPLSVRARNGRNSMPADMGRWASAEDNAFAALNAAYFTDGAFLKVPVGVRVEEPVRLLHVSTDGESANSSHARHFIHVGAGGRLTVVDAYLSLTGSAHLTNVVVELVVDDEATLEWTKFQDENLSSVHMATLSGTFGRSTQSRIHSFALGSRLSRTNIRAHLGGAGLECTLNGLYLTRGQQVADHHMVVEHAQPHCVSHEYFNGILDERSRGVFHGRILVRQEAQKTDAKQTNKNILLSDEAQVDTKPQLEIYADDVKCTHGATVGQLDPNSIFYLRARGVGLETARRMLIHSFAGEIIGRVQNDAVREELDQTVWDRLEQNPRIAASGDNSDPVGEEHV